MEREPIATETEAPWRAQLRRLLARLLAERRGGNASPIGPEWGADKTLLRGLGVDLRETFTFVLEREPTLAELEAWIEKRRGGPLASGQLERLDAALRGDLHEPPGEPVLTAADLAFFDECGYVLVRDAVTPAQCAAAERAIWEFLEMDPADPDTWYGNQLGATIWVPLFHHPAVDENRRAPRIHGAFAQLWGRGDLWATVDQVGFNRPERPGHAFPGPNLHWDASLVMPMPLGLAGVLYLVDVAENQGAFSCVPGFHKRIEAWLASLPPGADPRAQDLDALGRVTVPGRAGDLVIWHEALPHGSSPNRAERPRIVQYITLEPSLRHRDVEWK
jgi:hypothetical protein